MRSLRLLDLPHHERGVACVRGRLCLRALRILNSAKFPLGRAGPDG